MADRYLLDQTLQGMIGNPQQIEAVHIKGHCVVLAGPGSGKTRTLAAAMARALLEDIKEPRGIACITYNNECAIELESRLANLGIESGEQVFIGTVHSFALTQVIIPYARCVLPDLPPLIRIATKQQRDSAVAVAYSNIINDGGNPKYIWLKVEQKRKQDLDRNAITWMKEEPLIAHLIEAYESELRRQGLIDFDDMPLLAFRMVKEHEWIRKSLQAKFPILFVDEYQDLGTALHELVLQLCFKANIRLFAVGDPDQSIYRFTGADPALLKALAGRKDVRTIILPFNYRCGTRIIEASKVALGEERDHRAPDGAHQGEIIFDAVNGDLQAQANFVMRDLIPLIRSHGISPEKTAVLYRTAAYGDTLAIAADAQNIPVVRADSRALIPRNNRLSRLVEAAAQWVIGGWKNSDPPFRRLSLEATSFVFNGRASTEERHNIETSLISFLHRTTNAADSTHQWLLGFRDTLLTSWRSRASTITDDWDVIDRMLTRTDGTEGNQDVSLSHFSGHIEQSGRLNLSTLHSAKGREFEAVILFGMNDDILPDDRDQRGQEELREARRLFYVAVTRTKKELHLVFKYKHYSPWVAELYRRFQRSNTTDKTPYTIN